MRTTKGHLRICRVTFPSMRQKLTLDRFQDFLANVQEKVQSKCPSIVPVSQWSKPHRAFCSFFHCVLVYDIPKRIFKPNACLDQKKMNIFWTHYIRQKLYITLVYVVFTRIAANAM